MRLVVTMLDSTYEEHLDLLNSAGLKKMAFTFISRGLNSSDLFDTGKIVHVHRGRLTCNEKT